MTVRFAVAVTISVQDPAATIDLLHPFLQSLEKSTKYERLTTFVNMLVFKVMYEIFAIHTHHVAQSIHAFQLCINSIKW